MKYKLLFLCTGNSCRSQMAEAFARHYWPELFDAYSAGIAAHGLNPNAVAVMAEKGIDISNYKSKTLSELPINDFDFVITVCGHADEVCPTFRGATKKIHRGFDDPPKLAAQAKSAEEALNCYRRVRDEISEFVMNLPQFLKLDKEEKSK